MPALSDATPGVPGDGAPEERFLPEAVRDQLIEAERFTRYRFAAAIVQGRRVLDAGCGGGRGSQILLDHGAASVDGIDIDESAVRESREHCPAGTFVRGDLTDLPYSQQRFEMITCFEAIEYIENPLRVLDEFRRVLAPGGIVLVSSPNPDVYPAGNSFHLHEFRPSDFLAAMTDRFEHANLWRQHNLIASALHQDGVVPTDPAGSHHHVTVLADLAAEREVYSLVVASESPLPDMHAMVALSSSRQRDDLAATAARLEEDARLHDTELAGMRTERDRAWLRLLDAEQELARSSAADQVQQARP